MDADFLFLSPFRPILSRFFSNNIRWLHYLEKSLIRPSANRLSLARMIRDLNNIHNFRSCDNCRIPPFRKLNRNSYQLHFSTYKLNNYSSVFEVCLDISRIDHFVIPLSTMQVDNISEITNSLLHFQRV